MKRPSRTVLFNVFLAFAMSLSTFVAWKSYEKNTVITKAFFERIVVRDFYTINHALDNQADLLGAISAYFLASEDTDQAEFKVFSRFFEEKNRSIEASGLISMVGTVPAITYITFPHNQSEYKFLEGVRFENDVKMKEMLQASLSKPHETLYFFDLPQTIRSLFKKNLSINTLPSQQVFMLRALYKEGANNKDKFLGYSFSVLNFQRVIEDTLQVSGKSFLAVNIHLEDQQGKRHFVYKTLSEPVYGTGFQTSHVLNLGSNKLIFHFMPTKYFMSMQGVDAAILALCGIFVIFFLVGMFYFETSRYVRGMQLAQERAEEANKLKNDFLATMSHEIRSPMTGVLGMAELLMNTDLSTEQRSYTRTILGSGEALMNIIEDILDFSKIEANKLSLDPQPTNMLDLVDDVILLYFSKAREKAIELVVRYVPGTEQFVYIDPLRMQQVLGNLINNAIKFTEKGHVVLTVEKAPNTEQTGDVCNLKFSVQDTGIGIAPEAKNMIFEKFMQADNSTTRTYGGTGLGLPICKRLIELMGGQIHVESIPGQGSVFSFILPLRRNTNETPKDVQMESLHDLRVLVVDDLDVVRTLLEEQLVSAGMQCDLAETGEEALGMIRAARVANKPYQIVLVDYLLPGMNGDMLACAISDEQNIQDICLVMMTSAGMPVSSDEILRRGFSAYLAKPLRHELLMETLLLVWESFSAGRRDKLVRVDLITADKNSTDDWRLPEGTKVLLAEDSRINQAFAEDVLDRLGCSVTIAANGSEAVRMTQIEEFDIVLMDCQMPIMDGFEATLEIEALKKAGRIRADLPVIALTANAMKGDRQRCINAGMLDYLSKPVRTRDLKEKTSFWVARQGRPEIRKAVGTMHTAQNTHHESLRSLLESNASTEYLDANLFAQAQGLMKEKFPLMLDYFFEDTNGYLDEIDQYLNAENYAEAIRPAHTIKSTALRMGAVNLSQIAKSLEANLIALKESGRMRANEDEIAKYHVAAQALRHVFIQTQKAMQQSTKAA